MLKSLRANPIAWVLAGALLGVVLSGLLPHTPSLAVGTDRQDTFAICTGPVDDDLEAIYFLDFLTGDLRAAVLSQQTQKFSGLFQHNVARDLAAEQGGTPRYAMITGMANLKQNRGQVSPGNSILYVAEGTSGKIAAYALPWNGNRAGSTRPYTDAFWPIDLIDLRTAAVRGN